MSGRVHVVSAADYTRAWRDHVRHGNGFNTSRLQAGGGTAISSSRRLGRAISHYAVDGRGYRKTF